MTDPISNERLAELVALANEASKIPHNADLCSALRELQSRRQSPAGVEPVGEAGAMPGSNGGVTMAAFEASKVPAGTKLYASPPKAVTITDEMVERAADELVAHGEFSWNPSDNRRRAAIAARAALTAALSSEDRNG
ncbi:hypothetical protein [Devosia sp.]|uniref:hypothetical protein n=1 Tax=Devosia sp. TaxID=1871048 RepID=UPI002AFDE6A1|nr:hypothetical protein [Devosia sp.]